VAWQQFENSISPTTPFAVIPGLVFSGGGAGNEILRAADGTALGNQNGSLGVWNDPVSSVAIANGWLVVSSGRVIDVYKVPGA
jgi:hypothetical protein